MNLKKVFYYDPVYLNFTNIGFVQEGEGIHLPSSCTILPPPLCPSDHIQIFDPKKNIWQIKKKSESKYFLPDHTTFEVFYEFGKTHQNSDPPILFPIKSPHLINDPLITDILKYLNPISKFNRYTNPFSVTLKLSQRIFFINNKLALLFAAYSAYRKQAPMRLSPYAIAYLEFEISDIINHIKRIFDILIISTYLDTTKDIQLLDGTNQLICDGIGYLFNTDKSSQKMDLLEKLHFDHYEDLFSIINEIHNAHKHDILAESIGNLIYQEPCVIVRKFHRPKKNLSNIRLYQVELKKVIFACNDFLNILFKHNHICNAPKFQIFGSNQPENDNLATTNKQNPPP